MKAAFLLVFFCVSFGVYANEQPINKQTLAVTTEPQKNAGQRVYDRFCIVCHRDGLIGAPRMGEEKDWKPRLDKKTIDDLLTSAIKGLNAMPAKGTCSECTDNELKEAIEYMLPKS